MKIVKIAATANDYEVVYKHLRDALQHLSKNHIGKTKNEIKKAIGKLEKMRPDLKNIDKLQAYYKYKGWR